MVTSAPVGSGSCYFVILIEPFTQLTAPLLQSHALFWTLVSTWLCDQKSASPLHNEIFQDNNNNDGAPDAEWGMEAGVNLEQAES